MADTAAPASPDNRLSRFVNRPGHFKVVAVVLAYLAFYLVVSNVIGLVAGSDLTDDPVASATSILVVVALPVAIGAVGLLWFIRHVGWSRAIFGRQPIGGSWWMWLGPILVLTAVVAHVGQTDWSRWSAAELGALAVLGVSVGIAEELITRGVAVTMLRAAGHRELVVAAGSSALFALMHLSNLLAGMSPKIVGATVVYTFGFGMCMYLAMRVSGTILTAIVLHGLTDPTTVLATGGIDQTVKGAGGADGWKLAAALATFGLVAFGVLSLLGVRGRVGDAAEVGGRRRTGGVPPQPDS